MWSWTEAEDEQEEEEEEQKEKEEAYTEWQSNNAEGAWQVNRCPQQRYRTIFNFYVRDK